ncbi:hypothetical protein CHARACLAT_015436 [Characodon lateralis]|uniref:Uncharacterized protein n=1 Tax=Characodon lateralis TaxID=208331 RepID=A0ABU7E1F6_9TELE|nr:hypothetical protein [Characodon lateralis]
MYSFSCVPILQRGALKEPAGPADTSAEVTELRGQDPRVTMTNKLISSLKAKQQIDPESSPESMLRPVPSNLTCSPSLDSGFADDIQRTTFSVHS